MDRLEETFDAIESQFRNGEISDTVAIIRALRYVALNLEELNFGVSEIQAHTLSVEDITSAIEQSERGN